MEIFGIYIKNIDIIYILSLTKLRLSYILLMTFDSKLVRIDRYFGFNIIKSIIVVIREGERI